MRAATLVGVAIIAAFTASACERGTQQPPQSPPSNTFAPAAETPSAPAPKRLTLAYDKAQTPKPVVGTAIEATAEGLPPNKTVRLVWGTVEGGWVIEDYFHFRG